MKTAFVFAGQGAQYAGMGKDLCDNYKEAADVFDIAGEKIKQLCFYGTDEELKETENTQPCIYTMTMAAYEAFKARSDIEPAACAGFSLGEYSALTAAGYIDSVSIGAELLKSRGRWMSEAGKNDNGEQIGTMAAVIGDPDKVMNIIERIRGDGILTAANFNTPSQTVVSGDIASVERFCDAAAGEKLRVTPLQVSGAFHSSIMKPAAEKMKKLLLESNTAQSAAMAACSSIPVYSNLTAAPVKDYRRRGREGEDFSAEDFAELMGLQLMSSVQWVSTIRSLLDEGVDMFIEFGPGRTLSGLIKKIDRSVTTLRVEDSAGLEDTLNEIGGK